MTTTTDHLLPPDMRALLDTAPAIVDRLRVMFSARSLDATPAELAARIGIDTTYSTPSLALILEAEDPTGYYEYACVVTITGATDGDYLWVDDYRHGQQTTDNLDPEPVAALVFGIMLDRLPDPEDLS